MAGGEVFPLGRYGGPYRSSQWATAGEHDLPLVVAVLLRAAGAKIQSCCSELIEMLAYTIDHASGDAARHPATYADGSSDGR